jgi:hypothetical protein
MVRIKVKRFLHKWFNLPLFDNQFQKDISFWMDAVRFKKYRHIIYGIKLKDGKMLDWKKFLRMD